VRDARIISDQVGNKRPLTESFASVCLRYFRISPKATELPVSPPVSTVPGGDTAALFDHLVGAQQQR
jgi:hypothetical protein